VGGPLFTNLCHEMGAASREGCGRESVRDAGLEQIRTSRPSRPAHILMPLPNAGRYDGVVGVLGGAGSASRAQGERFQSPRRTIELIVFTAEEPTRFGIGCLGSRLLSGRSHRRKPRHCAIFRDELSSNGVNKPATQTGSLESVRQPKKLLCGFYRVAYRARDPCSSRKA